MQNSIERRKELPDEQLDEVSGGRTRGDQYTVACPDCGHQYTVSNLECEIKCDCGTSFEPAACILSA